MRDRVKYRAVYNRHGTLNLQRKVVWFGREFWLPYVFNLSLYAAQRIMERRDKKPIYFLEDGTTVPDIW